MNDIAKLIERKGSWAARALVEDAIQQKVNNSIIDKELALKITDHASGLSARRYLKRFSELTSIDIDYSNVREEIPDETWSIIDLDKIDKIYGLGYFSKIWIERLLLNLNCNKDNLIYALHSLFKNDAKPQDSHVRIIEEWSWPFIQKMYNIERLDKKINFKYIENDLAKLVWRKWYITDDNNLFLIDTKEKSDLTFGQWFVYRALHDATHLLHISTYPEQPKPTDPDWLVVMEAFAFNTECQFYNLLEHGKLSNFYSLKDSDLHRIKSFGLLYLLDRALRVDFDILVHLKKQSIDEWYEYVKQLTGLNTLDPISKEFLDITTEFHGLPGLGSAYFLGAEALQREDNKIEVWLGKKTLSYF